MDVIEVTEREVEVIEVIERGPAGPAGAAGTGLETLQVQGDTLYRGASTGERLPIGSAGQILRVDAAGAAPEWATNTDFGASPRQIIGNTTVNGAVVSGFSAPHTSYTIPAPTRFGPQQNGTVRIWVDRPFAQANLTLNLLTAASTQVENGDIVEIYNIFTLPGYKVIVDTQGFGTFDLFPRQSAVFVYQASGGPPRWIKIFDNQFSSTVPTSSQDAMGVIGDMAASMTHFYVKVPTNVVPGVSSAWRRVPWAEFQ